MSLKSPKSKSLEPQVSDLVPVAATVEKRATPSQAASVIRGIAALLILISIVVILSLLRSQLAAREEGKAPASELRADNPHQIATGKLLPSATFTPTAVKIEAPIVAPTAPALPDGLFKASTLAEAPKGEPNPFFSANYNPNDGKPIYICGADAFASYLTLVQIQVMGGDVANGFHLGIVPYSLNDQGYGVSQALADQNLSTGKWDCELNTVDSVARTGYGVITAIVDESAGGDGMWARRVTSIYDLRGKRIAYVRDTSSEFFVRYTLLIAQLDPANDVTLLPFDTMEDAIASFNEGRADAVSGWEPTLADAGKGGGSPLVSTDQLRVIVDALVTSRRSIETKPDTVQAFHNAWFAAIKVQTDYFDIGAAEIAAWGSNNWSGISIENPAEDLRTQMKQIAQAGLADNAYVMKNLSPILNHMNTARRVWAAAGVALPTDKVETLIDGRFVEHAMARADLQVTGKPVNATFSLADVSNTAKVGQANLTSETLAVLPCRKFSFLPDSTELTPESRRVLDLCVVPAMQQRVGVSLLIRGSAAWPGPKGTFVEADILGIAKARAQAIADYLVLQRIDMKRLMIEGVLPPDERRETLDVAQQAIDRYVEMTLVAGQ